MVTGKAESPLPSDTMFRWRDIVLTLLLILAQQAVFAAENKPVLAAATPALTPP